MRVSFCCGFVVKKNCLFSVIRQPTNIGAVNGFVVICRMPQFEILLINTRVPRSTRQLVEDVRQKHSMVREDCLSLLLYSCDYYDRHSFAVHTVLS